LVIIFLERSLANGAIRMEEKRGNRYSAGESKYGEIMWGYRQPVDQRNSFPHLSTCSGEGEKPVWESGDDQTSP
jgi:hypothetical protein